MTAELLVQPETLAAHLDDPNWVVFDVRADLADHAKGAAQYAAGHVPGAYHLDLERDLSSAKSGRNGRHPLPSMEAFTALMDERGVRPGTQVVAYDESGNCYAVRLWWMLKWAGHDRVAVLDGGWPGWSKEGRPASTESTPLRKGAFAAKPVEAARVDAAYVDRIRNDPSTKLIDARTAERFAGRNETLDPVGGHVPGAVNRFWQLNLDRGRFKAPEVLREEFTQLLGGTDPAQAVHMCGSGVTACHNLFAMALAGFPLGRLYPGSWSEWCSDPARAVAKD